MDIDLGILIGAWLCFSALLAVPVGRYLRRLRERYERSNRAGRLKREPWRTWREQ